VPALHGRQRSRADDLLVLRSRNLPPQPVSLDGIDLAVHAESAYEFGTSHGGGGGSGILAAMTGDNGARSADKPGDTKVEAEA